MQVLVLGGADYQGIFLAEGFGLALDTEEADLVCFTGGTDINPQLYAQVAIAETDHPDIQRDAFEEQVFQECVRSGIPMVGICRGAQLLCALSGGHLFQDVAGHLTSHKADTADGRDMLVTSSHHQMMDPRDTKHSVLMWADNRSGYYITETIEKHGPPVDYEVVYFHETRALSHQPHPEWMERTSQYYQWFFKTVDQLMRGDLE